MDDNKEFKIGDNDVEYLIAYTGFKSILPKELLELVNKDLIEEFKPTLTILTEDIMK